MHYIEYHPGTIARITDQPTRHGHEDVNLLSRWVCKINDIFRLNPSYPNHIKVQEFCRLLKQFQLPCSS